MTAFRGIYYHESGDIRPGHISASPFDYSFDRQGYVASKLHSGTAVYSSYIGLISTGIMYPQREDPLVSIDQCNYFDVIGTIPPIANHHIWGCLHFLPLVSNVFLARYESGTFLSHLTEGGYGFDVPGLPGIDMYQMYIVAPMVKAGMTYLLEASRGVPHFSGLSSIGVKVRSTWLPVKPTSFRRGEVWVLSVAPCQHGYVLTPSLRAQV